MQNEIRVAVLGTGQMGSGIVRFLLKKKGIELAGAFGRRVQRAGMDLGQAAGLGHDLGIFISSDLSCLIEQTRPHIAIQATCSTLDEAADELLELINQGVNVISIAEEMAFPAAKNPDMAAKLHLMAVKNNVAVLGTGINPGFVLDLLVILLTGVCVDIRSITATRVNDLSAYGPSVLNTQGVGLTPEQFSKGLQDGSVVGHYGFEQSIQMIASAVGWDIEDIKQTREPIISTVRRETAHVTVEPGRVAGCLHTAAAYKQGKPVIQLIHPQQVQPQVEGIATGDSIEISGTPDVNLSGSPEIPGGKGTAALAVNMIPRVLNAAPGLYSMADLPVPAATLGDVRRFVSAL